MQQWKTRQLKYVKFVIPMYHPRIDLGPGKSKASALKAISTFTKAPQEGQGDLQTDKMKSIDNSLEPSVQVLYVCMYVCMYACAFVRNYAMYVCMYADMYLLFLRII